MDRFKEPAFGFATFRYFSMFDFFSICFHFDSFP